MSPSAHAPAHEEQRILMVGKPDSSFVDNSVISSKYTVWSFLPLAIGEQFRRKGNVYFLVMGLLMLLGYYTAYFDSAISPWTTLGPLAIVVFLSMTQEGVADLSRHNSDRNTNQFLCTIVTRRTWGPTSEEAKKKEAKRAKRERRSRRSRGKIKLPDEFSETVSVITKKQADGADAGAAADVEYGEEANKPPPEQSVIEFHSVKRKDIYPGQIVLVRNRDMIPCDIVLLASSGDNGGAYIETSGIDGETNLKLRNAAKPPRVASTSRTTAARTSFSMDEPTVMNDHFKEAAEGDTDDNNKDGAGDREENDPDSPSSPSNNLRSSLRNPKYSPSSESQRKQPSSSAAASSFQTPPSSPSRSKSNTDDKKNIAEPSQSTVSSADPNSKVETLQEATARIANTTVLGHQNGQSCLGLKPSEQPGGATICQIRHPSVSSSPSREGASSLRAKFQHMKQGGADQYESIKHNFSTSKRHVNSGADSAEGQHQNQNVSKRSCKTLSKTDEPYVAMLTSELPNASVHTFSGKLTLPSNLDEECCVEVPLNAENFLLRGAFLRNTEWAIGVAVFTGKDSKLVKNSSSAPSRLSQLDELVNRTIVIIVGVMLTFVLALSIGAMVINAFNFDLYWYIGIEANVNQPWPYLPDLSPPAWDAKTNNLLQNLFLFTTLLNNFVPLSLYVTMEVVTRMLMTYINWDKNMYHEESDTPANARSTTVTDLGQIKYIFSDKTGTLTQNIMNFKRCSIDGLLFGAPIVKSAPSGAADAGNDTLSQKALKDHEGRDDNGIPLDAFHPLHTLLYGAGVPKQPLPAIENEDKNRSGIGNGMDPPSSGNNTSSKKYLTFNAEMFLRVMSICHTVVVETDYDDEDAEVDETQSGVSWLTSGVKNLVKRTSNAPGEGSISGNGNSQTPNTEPNQGTSVTSPKATVLTSKKKNVETDKKNVDGAPHGESYQAESPDEGALVSAASNLYDFQFLGRDSTGIRISCKSPSLLGVSKLASDLKKGSLLPQQLAALSASTDWDQFIEEQVRNSSKSSIRRSSTTASSTRGKEEVWEVLAVNKFDSTRKRMSVVVRSPPELGNVMMLLCKGADSAMLDPEICQMGDSTDNDGTTSLAMNSHLGQFATEGLRTLVLAVRILPEEYGEDWVARHAAAASSIKNRDDKLTEVAEDIEKDLHVVGITAIEDKLQDGVPEAISKLASAGIKLWVLTGDKRETAIEIGYSTKVLTPAMTLFQVSNDGPGDDTGGTKKADRIRTIVASEFMRLVKTGALPQYQNDVLKAKAEEHCRFFKDVWDLVAFTWNYFWDWFWFFICLPCRVKRSIFHADDVEDPDDIADADKKKSDNDQEFEVNVVERRRAVRETAENVIKKYLESKKKSDSVAVTKPSTAPSKEIQQSEEQVLQELSDSSPTVFDRASAAEGELRKRGNSGAGLQSSLRSVSIASSVNSSIRLVDEDMLSLASFRMDDQTPSNFSNKKRTLLERTFAIDRDVRHGELHKHLKKSTREENGPPSADYQQPTAPKPKPAIIGEHTEEVEIEAPKSPTGAAHESIALDVVDNSQPRALIVEGAALAFFMTDPLLQEMLFAVASCCDAIIACRVSPKQKALLVRTVRTFVLPEPLTLAIGDGANDVGMIQEAHVGIGISGLEGQQAVNASDFSIAQFRFLEELLLTHGRWSFTRMARVVLYSFYKNAVLAGCLVAFCGQNEFSGTSLFDEWVISMFNFVCTIPILFVGLFDRDVPREYVQSHPQLYAAGPSNEEMSLRKVFRWVAVTLGHTFVIFFIGFPMLNYDSTVTSAWRGLMWNASRDYPGDGEGDLATAGLAIYTVMVFTLTFKALFETKSIIYGQLVPCFTCCDKSNDGCASRLQWTWNGVIWGSILFYMGAVYLYEYTALGGNPSYTQFIGVASHTFETRGVVWLTVFLVPITAVGFDVMFKTVANMYFPTQTQIHAEICVMHEEDLKRQAKKCCSCTLPQFQVASRSPGAVIYNEEQGNDDKKE